MMRWVPQFDDDDENGDDDDNDNNDNNVDDDDYDYDDDDVDDAGWAGFSSKRKLKTKLKANFLASDIILVF